MSHAQASPASGAGGAAGAQPDRSPVSVEVPSIKTPDDWEPTIIGFLCNWCSYAGSDLTGTSRTQYPPNIRIIRVPCSSRVDPSFILNALQTTADGVLVSGCHPGDCHYITGNYYARRRFLVTRELLQFVGYHPDRVRFSWVSAAEGAKFAKVVYEVTEGIRRLGPLHRFRKTDLLPRGNPTGAVATNPGGGDGEPAVKEGVPA